ncbi:MAG: alkaline phosphatase family protein [Acidobacteriota bacterium]
MAVLTTGPREILGALRSSRGLAVLCACLLGLLAAACGDGRNPGAVVSDGAKVPAITANPTGRPVIFVGLDGADWQFLDPLIIRGVMPNLAQLVREGESGILETQHPPLSPLVWTSMMTGRSPLEHRILDFTRFNPASGVREPITSDERAVPAIWDMAHGAGLATSVIGMWATFPATDTGGLMVSDRVVQYGSTSPEAVSPPARASVVASARAAAEESVNFGALASFLPSLQPDEFVKATATDPGEAYREPISALRRIVIETRLTQSLALLGWQDRPRLEIVYFEGTDTIGHEFAPFAPPRQDTIAAPLYERLHAVPERYFAEIDRDLGELRDAAAAAGAVLMIASDHGFRWSEGRPLELSSLAAASAARWHRDDGIFVLWRPGAPRRGEWSTRPHGSARQVCATLLALLGLPAASGSDLGPLPGATASPGGAIDYAASFHSTPPNPRGRTAVEPSDEELSRLRALGYVGGADATTGRLAGSTRTPPSFNNEGLLLREQGKTQPAAAAFQQALALDPHYASAAWNLSDLLAGEGREPERADALLLQAVDDGLPEGAERLVARAAAYRTAQGAQRSVRLLDDAVRRLPRQAPLWLYRGRYRLELQDCAGAREDFARSVTLDRKSALGQASLGTAALCLGDTAGARRAFTESLRLDPNQPELRKMLAGGR